MNYRNLTRRALGAVAAGGVAIALVSCSTGDANPEQTDSGQAVEAPLPTGTVEITVGFAAGGSTDINVRALANATESQCDIDLLVRNQPGASGVIGLEAVKGAAPDGYSLSTSPTELSSYVHLGLSDLTYEDFSAVTLYLFDPNGFYVTPGSEFKSIGDVIEAAEAGEVIRIGTSGPASPHAVTFEQLAQEAGVSGQLVNVPFDGDGSSIPAALGGEIDVLVTTPPPAAAFVKSGDLVPLAIASEERIEIFPDTPTLREEGFDVVGGAIFGLLAPVGTPDNVRAYLDDCFRQGLESDEYQAFLTQQGGSQFYLGPDDFQSFLADEHVRYGEILTSLGLAKG